jgi:hypothetical protein
VPPGIRESARATSQPSTLASGSGPLEIARSWASPADWRLTRRLRARSTPRLRVTRYSQVAKLPRFGSNDAALCQTLVKASCTSSSAMWASPKSLTPVAYTGRE